MDLNDYPCSGKTLSKLLQPAVMAVLAREPVHGYRIVHELEQMAMFRDGPPDPTGVYRVLKSMEGKGLVVSSWEFSDTGPAKRRYELTVSGRACLDCWICTLREYSAAVVELLDKVKQAAGGQATKAHTGRAEG